MINKTLSLLALVVLLGEVGYSQEIFMPANVLAKQQRVPDTVIYEVLMHQTASFKDAADQKDRDGGDGTPFREHMAKKFELSSEQLVMLNSVAMNYREEVKQPDQALGDSIRRFRQLNGSQPKGSKALPPPSEAKTLIANRDAVLNRSCDRLRSMLGDVEFARIDTVVRQRIGHDLTNYAKPAEAVDYER